METFPISKETASQNFVPRDETKLNPFFAGACITQKIQLRLSVWNLAALLRPNYARNSLYAHRRKAGASSTKLR